jgi:hypothetical protein
VNAIKGFGRFLAWPVAAWMLFVAVTGGLLLAALAGLLIELRILQILAGRATVRQPVGWRSWAPADLHPASSRPQPPVPLSLEPPPFPTPPFPPPPQPLAGSVAQPAGQGDQGDGREEGQGEGRGQPDAQAHVEGVDDGHGAPPEAGTGGDA